MKGHGLVQAIARVNRVFRDKPAGLVVDYLGLAELLRDAVGQNGGDRTGGGGADGSGGSPESTGLDPVKIAVLQEKFGVVKAMFHGYDYSGYFGGAAAVRLTALEFRLAFTGFRLVQTVDE